MVDLTVFYRRKLKLHCLVFDVKAVIRIRDLTLELVLKKALLQNIRLHSRIYFIDKNRQGKSCGRVFVAIHWYFMPARSSIKFQFSGKQTHNRNRRYLFILNVFARKNSIQRSSPPNNCALPIPLVNLFSTHNRKRNEK